MPRGEETGSNGLFQDSLIADFNQSEFATLLGMEITEAQSRVCPGHHELHG